MTARSILARRAAGEKVRPLDHPYVDVLREQRMVDEDALRRQTAEQQGKEPL